MYNFYVQSWLTFKGLFHWLNRWGYLSSTVLYPFATVTMFAILGRFASNPDLVRTYALGIAVSCIAWIAIAGITQSYTRERYNGGTSFVFVSTVNRLTHFISRSVFHFPNALVAFFFGMLAAWIIVDLDFSAVNWPTLILAVLAIDLAVTAYAQLLGVASVAVRNWIGIQGLANTILLILSGIIIPVSVLPGFLQEIAKLLPITNGLAAFRAAFTGAPLAEVSGNILREFITGLVYYAAAYFAFVFFEKAVKRSGTLERDAI
ncbi:MAG: ABC transporter permease [Dehalococcoidales bacterium]|jgi:ABC-type polysaccharide/polyol phosphate export permease